MKYNSCIKFKFIFHLDVTVFCQYLNSKWMTLENISCYKSKAVFPMCMWYHKWQKFVSQENLDPRLWLLRSRLWFSQFCSFGFHSDSSICSTMPFPSIWKFWSCCLSFHWLSIIFTMGYLVSHCLWLFLCWLGQFLWSFERCSMRGYL